MSRPPVPPSPGAPFPAGAPPLLVVTDRAQAASAGHTVASVVAAATDAGARAVLLREKDLPPHERLVLAERLRAVLEPAGGSLVVAGDRDLARRVGAAAVHLAAADPWPAARGPSPAMGCSCHSPAELRAAVAAGAAYVTLSPVLATASKPGYGPVLGYAGLATACAAVPDLPVVALGGLGPERAAACLAAGAAGVAVMGEVMRAVDPAAVVRRLVAELDGDAGGPRHAVSLDPGGEAREVPR